MAPLSSSKQARLAKKAEKAAEKNSKSSGTSTPQADTNGTVTPATSVHGGDDGPVDEMAKLRMATERTGTGVLVSEKRSRDIKIEQYTLQYHGKVLIESSDIELNHGNRYGLLAENGAGKSTFLRSLAERDVEIPEQFDVFLLNEEAELSDMLPTEAVIAHAREKVTRIEKEVEELSISDNVDELELQAKYEELEDLDPSTFESKAALILVGLGFDKMMLNRPIKAMSGGWRMRVALARALFVRPDVLLLDEPTNHLDLEAVVWLEAYLSTYNKILVVNSHSQDFLNSVCTHMIEITLDRRIVQYGGNYDTYLKTKQDFEVNHMKAYAKQQEEIAHIRKFIASAGTYANLVKQAKSKQKIIDKMEAAGLLQPITIPKSLSFVFPDVRPLPPPIIAFNDVAFSYDGDIKNALYKDLSFGIDMDSRVAIVGKNGTGKSTLLNLITGVLTPIQGSINRYSGLKLAKYSQHSADQLPFNKPPLQHLIDTYKERYPEKELQGWRQQLGRFGISGPHQTADIRTLSDGLKSRVVFSQLALEGPHILLFDEPTNHLDISSIDALAKAINEFGGGLVLVSHDFRLISQVARELWEVKDKKVVKLDMTIQEYKKELMKESQDIIENARKMAKGAAT